MDKRLLLALAISMGILFAWWKIFPPQQPPPPAPVAQQQPTTPAPAPAPAPGQAAAPTAGAAAPTDSKGAAANAPEQWLTLDTADADYVLSSWGGTLRQVKLKEKKFQVEDPKTKEKKPLQTIGTFTADTAPFVTTFTSNDFSLGPTVPYAVARPAPNVVVFTAEVGGVVVEKTYSVEPGRYRLRLDVNVSNQREKSITESLVLHLYGRQDPEKKGGSFLSYASAVLAEMVCYLGEDTERHNIDDLNKGEKTFNGTIRWIAADEKFFTVAAVPHPDTVAGAQKCLQRALDGLTGEVLIPFTNRTIAPGQKTSYSFTAFAGPKYKQDLEAVQPGGQDPRLVAAVNSSYRIIAFLSEPLLWLLKKFHGFTHNWGVAIILLTIFVRILTFYPQQRTMMSAKKMQKLAPKMAAIRKKYENDRQRVGVETMNLYKAHGVSPLGGCLPALIQMPIWMALFSTLNSAVELHRSGFIFYIHDLSAPDPYYATPLLMGVVMFLQMRMSPAGADPQQQKMMSIMMPIMFTVFSLFLPAGLAIYTLTSYLIGILQQLLVNYLDKRRDLAAAAPAKAKS
jgi:YidC/Oxa1 family membrane protein insertase